MSEIMQTRFEQIPTSNEIAELAANHLDTDAEYDIDESPYLHSLDHKIYGRPQNWDSKHGGWTPENCVEFMKERETVAKGLADAVEHTLAEFEDDTGRSVPDSEVFGLVEELTSYARGAIAELLAEEVITEKRNLVRDPCENDESNRIDIRTIDTLYQVKLTDTKPRSDWKLPKATSHDGDSERERELVWVQPDGTVNFQLDEPEGGWSRSTRLVDRYEPI